MNYKDSQKQENLHFPNKEKNSETGKDEKTENKNLSEKSKMNITGGKKNIRKVKRAKGEAYIDSKGNQHQPKCLLPSPCLGKQNHDACNKISEEDRQMLYNEFRTCDNIDSQRQYLLNLIDRNFKKLTTIKDSVNPRRKFTFKYNVMIDKIKLLVCRHFFMATFNVTDALIRSSVNKVNKYGRLEPDKRGKHQPHNKLSDVAENFIRSHIESFPFVKSRKSIKKKYLDSSLNVKIMHSKYIEKCSEKQIKPAGLAKYRQIFKSYNLGFIKFSSKSKKDQCKRCVTSLHYQEEQEVYEMANAEDEYIPDFQTNYYKLLM